MSQLTLLLFLLQIPNISLEADQKEKDLAQVMFESVKGKHKNLNKFQKYASEFYKNGKRFNIDPVLSACVAHIESKYIERPSALWSTKCTLDRCFRIRVSAGETGMMQVLWYDGSTKKGYEICTGEKLTGSKKKRRRKLTPYKVSICVGIYELSKFKEWSVKRKRRWQWQKSKYNLNFFRRNVNLRKHFWVQHYNWGPKVRMTSYPRKVLSCYSRFQKKLRKIELARIENKRTDGKLGYRKTIKARKRL